MAPSKMTCKNNDKFMYTGKEMSPLGLGFCSDAENVGSQMIGRDGKTWIVGIKNGEKIWIRAPEKMVLPKEEPLLEAGHSEEEEAHTPVKEIVEEAEVPAAPEKPKRKYTRKAKTPEPEEDKVARKLDLEEEVVAAPEEVVAEVKVKKVSERKAPAEKAGGFEEGTEKVGADGLIYVIKADKNGTKKWAKKTTEKPAKKAEEVVAAEEVVEAVVEKPKRKYTRKLKEEVVNDDAAPKKERKKRGPTAYNLFIGAKLKELREKAPGKDTTLYMREALDIWASLTEEEKKAISAA